jgi:hypothetical protein
VPLKVLRLNYGSDLLLEFVFHTAAIGGTRFVLGPPIDATSI